MRKLKAESTEPALLLTLEEARALLQIGRSQMLALVRSKEIASINYGKSIRIPRQAIMNHIETRIQKQQAG